MSRPKSKTRTKRKSKKKTSRPEGRGKRPWGAKEGERCIAAFRREMSWSPPPPKVAWLTEEDRQATKAPAKMLAFVAAVATGVCGRLTQHVRVLLDNHGVKIVLVNSGADHGLSYEPERARTGLRFRCGPCWYDALFRTVYVDVRRLVPALGDRAACMGAFVSELAYVWVNMTGRHMMAALHDRLCGLLKQDNKNMKAGNPTAAASRLECAVSNFGDERPVNANVAIEESIVKATAVAWGFPEELAAAKRLRQWKLFPAHSEKSLFRRPFQAAEL